MRATIENMQDTFIIGYDQYAESREEARVVWDMYHNRQYTKAQLSLLKDRGQPAETFNVIKLFARMLLGYYSSVVNTVVALPVSERDIPTAGAINDTISYVLRTNNFGAESDKIKLSGLLSGLLISYVDVKDTGVRDEFGRPINKVELSHVPDSEVVLDPSSFLEDYSDAMWIHRYKWMTEDKVVELFGEEYIQKIDEYHNHMNYSETDFESKYNGQFAGRYKVHNNYLVIHTVMKEDTGKTWSKYWSGDVILKENEITHKEVSFPYRVHKLHVSDQVEHYGIFREVIESQKSINQALIKLQLQINSQKIFVERTSVENIDDFTNAVNRVTGVIPVRSLKGIRAENLSRESRDQYMIIDKALDRIQRVLSINDSFLGMAFAADSGRKVKLQQNATVTALRYLTNRVEQFYRLLGWDIANLIKQYYTATQVIRISDDTTGLRFREINSPAEVPTGEVLPDGTPELRYVYEEVLDPNTNEPMIDDEGNYVIAPIPEADSELQFSNVDIEISSVSYNDEDEKNQLMLETTLSGSIGNMLAQVNPPGYFQAAALAMKSMKTKHSPDIANILEQTAAMLSGNPESSDKAAEAASTQKGVGSSKSKELKLPQNTNE